MTITWFYLIKPGLVVNPYKLFDIQITQSEELKYFIANIILLCCSVQSPRLLSLVLFDWSSQCGCHTILQITTIISSVNDCAALKRIDMVYHYLHHYLHQSDCQSWARLVELLNHGCHRYCLCCVRAEEQWMENIVVNCYESPWEFYQTNAKVEIKIHHVCFTGNRTNVFLRKHLHDLFIICIENKTWAKSGNVLNFPCELADGWNGSG